MASPLFTGLSKSGVPEGGSIFHAMQARADKRFSNGTFHSQLPVVQADPVVQPAGSFRHLPGAGGAGENRPHNLTVGGIRDLPFGSGRKLGADAPRVICTLISGWNLNVLYQWQTGPPLAWGNGIYYRGKTCSGIPLRVFNAFNPALFGDPNLSPTSSTFGVISSQANNARQVQMALRRVW